MTRSQPPDGMQDLYGAHRHELRAHCYRMTGSLADAEDLTQETFLRAWRHRDRFEHRASPRTWLYRIATNACLDFLKRHERRARPTDSIDQTLEREAWIDPFPDRLHTADPADAVARREVTTLRLVAALLHLPPRQRAVVVARHLLELDAAETGELLDCSATAVHSLVQRAHATLRGLADDLDALAAPSVPVDGGLVRAYVDAHQRGDADAVLALLASDVQVSMPPEAPCRGAADVRAFFEAILGPDGPGRWHLVPLRANGCAAVACYVAAPGDPTPRALSVDVLHVDRGRIASLRCFLGAGRFPALGLDLALTDR